jgi:hypothetical protein
VKDMLSIAGSRDLPERHQTIGATIAWSYNLLSETERMLLRRLSVFAGTFANDAVAALCADQRLDAKATAALLSVLALKSLVSIVPARTGVRYSLLSPIRMFAAEKLTEADESEAVNRRSAAWLADVADTIFANNESRETFADMLLEFDNVRAAIQRCLERPSEDDALLAGRIILGLTRLWWYTGRKHELVDWIESALTQIDDQRHAVLVSNLLWRMTQSSEGPMMLTAAARATVMLERVGNRRLAAAIHGEVAVEYAHRGDFSNANASAEHVRHYFSLEENAGTPLYLKDQRRRALSLIERAWIQVCQGNESEARRDLADSYKILTQLGSDSEAENIRLYVLAEVESFSNNLALSAEICEQIIVNVSSDSSLMLILAGS